MKQKVVGSIICVVLLCELMVIGSETLKPYTQDPKHNGV